MKSVDYIDIARQMGFTVLAGGVYLRRKVPEGLNADYICRGEGEGLPDFVLNGDESMFKSRLFYPDLNSLPLPDYELFRGIPFERGHLSLEGKRLIPYHSSRGCPYRCSFCEISIQKQPLRIRTRVKEDLECITKTYQPDMVFICDELLPYYSKRWRESWGGFSYPFFAYIRSDIEPEVLRWLIKRGMFYCAFGVESGDEEYRNNVLGKGLSDYALWRTVEILNRHNVEYIPFFMTGTPDEGFEQKMKTHRMMKEIGGRPILFEYEELRK